MEAWRGPQAFRAWLKIDSGMHRLGFAPGQAAAAIARLRACRFVAQPFGIATHLADAERADGLATRTQLAAFATATAGLSWRAKHRELGRADRVARSARGLGAARHHALRRLAVCRADRDRPRAAPRHVAGDAHHRAQGSRRRRSRRLWRHVDGARASRIAVAAVGYGDGYPRKRRQRHAGCRERRCRHRGGPALDGHADDRRHGPARRRRRRPRRALGRDVPVERVAAAAGTIAYELTCRVGRRVSFSTT